MAVILKIFSSCTVLLDAACHSLWSLVSGCAGVAPRVPRPARGPPVPTARPGACRGGP